jgi:preprotein translocase subunit SecE
MSKDKATQAADSTVQTPDTKQAKNTKSKKSAKKEKKPGFFSKVGRFFRDMKSEWKKIVWPSKKQVWNNTLVVLTVMAIVGVAVWILDWLLINGFNLMY